MDGPVVSDDRIGLLDIMLDIDDYDRWQQDKRSEERIHVKTDRR